MDMHQITLLDMIDTF